MEAQQNWERNESISRELIINSNTILFMNYVNKIQINLSLKVLQGLSFISLHFLRSKREPKEYNIIFKRKLLKWLLLLSILPKFLRTHLFLLIDTRSIAWHSKIMCLSRNEKH